MNDLQDSVDYKDLKFYEYRDSKERFNAIKNSQIKFSDAMDK